jgi:hypothetical protein
MPRDLLVAQGASVVGQWCRVEPPGHKTWPFRVITSGDFAGDSVFIEELTGGLPTSPGPLPGNPGLLTPNSQTGTVRELGEVAPGGPDLTIDAPVEFIRARCGAFTSGTASVRLLEAD